MLETIKEGNALIRIKKADKVSREMEVFYNPVMKNNRDISVLLLNCIENKNMQIGLPLEASGVRGIRLLKELEKGKIKSISFNDYDAKAVQSIKNNLMLNKINNFAIIKKTYNNANNKKNNKIDKKIKIYNEDASLFLLKSSGFDYIDVDPFGTSNPFLDAAVKRISRNGILAVTNTDTAALTGTYPRTCIRKYWAVPKRDYMMHETGLRILIRKIQLVGMQYEKALIPIFSYFKEHYFRIFFRCLKGKKICDGIAEKYGMLNDAGPLWLGDLWDRTLTNKMQKFSINNYFSNDKELLKFLKIINDESKLSALGFYDIHNAAEKMKLRIIPRKEEIIKKIIELGYKAAPTHFSGTGVRTNMPYNLFSKILKE
ncbi:MAG: hypothetical protein AABX34_03215 [Nanoarchaeota archaeon]